MDVSIVDSRAMSANIFSPCSNSGRQALVPAYLAVRVKPTGSAAACLSRPISRYLV
jgi:hypothetical protein